MLRPGMPQLQHLALVFPPRSVIPPTAALPDALSTLTRVSAGLLRDHTGNRVHLQARVKDGKRKPGQLCVRYQCFAACAWAGRQRSRRMGRVHFL